MRSFTINATTNSETDLGLRITVPPVIPTTRRVVDDVKVEGRAGTLTRWGGFEDLEFEIGCALNVGNGPVFEQLAKINATLGDPSDPLRYLQFSNLPQAYYQTKYAVVGEVEQISPSWWGFTITFICAPFAYLIDSGVTELKVGTNWVKNPGNVFAEPEITLNTSTPGTYELSAGGSKCAVKMEGYQLTIDTARRLCRVGDQLQVDALTGEFPTLNPGSNLVRIPEGITGAVLIGNWRNL